MDLHVRIEDLPLSGFSREESTDWWVSLDTFLLDDVVEGLGSSGLEVELVSNGFHLSLGVSFQWVLTIFFNDGGVHLSKNLLVHFGLVVPVIFLVSTGIGVLEDDVTINLDVEDEMVDLVINFEKSVFE